MALRLVEVTVTNSESASAALSSAVGETGLVDSWEGARGSRLQRKILLEARDAEVLVDRLAARYSADEHFRVVLLPVEATLPDAAREAETETATADAAASSTERPKTPDRVSREELRADLHDATRASPLFMVQVVISTLVAAVGLMSDNDAVVIGAMVIAPLLGPNVALAFGATLGDLAFMRRALQTNLVGLGLALVLSTVAGTLLTVDPSVPSIANRTSASISDIILALGAGVAGTLAMTSGTGTSLIGVMVAVALLPPLVTSGLLLGSGDTAGAFGAALLVAVNVICVNLAAVGTFIALGVRPREWWHQKGAKRSSRIAFLVWAVMLIVLLVLLLTQA